MENKTLLIFILMMGVFGIFGRTRIRRFCRHDRVGAVLENES